MKGTNWTGFAAFNKGFLHGNEASIRRKVANLPRDGSVLEAPKEMLYLRLLRQFKCQKVALKRFRKP